MKLPFLNFKKTAEKRYLGLFLKEKEGIGISISEKNGTMMLEDFEKFNYSNGWDNICEDVDEMLIKLEGRVNFHFKDTIFFVYSHFVDQETKQINKSTLNVIKTLVKSIELNAMGYIEAYEAIAKYLETRDEAPLTAIVTELDSTFTGLFIFKGGKASFTKIIPRGEDLIVDLEQVLTEIKNKLLLPSRIILYNSHHLDDLSTKIISHHWKEDFFVQLPKVEIVSEQEILKSLVSVFEEQILGETIQKTHVDDNNEMEVWEEEEIESQKSANNMGFEIGKDVSKENNAQVGVIEKKATLPKLTIFSSLMRFGQKVKQKIIFGQTKFSIGILITIGAAIILLTLVINEYYFHTANLRVFFPSQTIAADLTIPATVGANTGDLLITISTQSATYTEKTQTTGIRDVGTSAKGEVTLYNLEDTVKNLKQGVLLSVNGLDFTLDHDASISAATVDSATNASVPGKTKASITASAIGPESNLDKGKRFKIQDLSATVYYGINDLALAGGVRKQVKTVSKKDLDGLKAKILERANVADKPASGASSNKIIEELSERTLTNLKVSSDVGEAAESLTLSADVKSTNYTYDNNIILNLLIKKVAGKVIRGNVLKKENVQYTIKKVESKKNVITLTTEVKAKSTREVELADLLAKVTFKDKKNVESTLKNDYHADGFELSINQPLIIFNSWTPIFKKNISIEISSL